MRSVSQEVTDLLHLRTVALQNFRVAFRTGGPAEEFQAEIHALEKRIREVETRERQTGDR